MFKIGEEIVCVDDSTSGGYIAEGSVYTVVDADESEIIDSTLISVTEVGKEYCSWFANRFVLASEYNKEGVEQRINFPSGASITFTDKPIDTHYNYHYQLTQADIDAGEIKVDAYFVSQQWKLGSKDETGALFHCLKTITRFGEKNPVEREINALYKQVKRLAELNGVELK